MYNNAMKYEFLYNKTIFIVVATIQVGWRFFSRILRVRSRMDVLRIVMAVINQMCHVIILW